MAIPYKELRRLIRYKLKDNNEIAYSDYDIKEAFNECVRYFNASYALQNTDFLEKVLVYDEETMNNNVRRQNAELPEDEQLELYDFKAKGVELPEDYVTLQRVMRLPDGYIMSPIDGVKDTLDCQYKVMGGRLYFGYPTVKLLYKAAIAEINGEYDSVDVPFTFKDALVKITCMILQNNADTDVLADAVDDVVSKIVPRRRYSNARVKMPFMV